VEDRAGVAVDDDEGVIPAAGAAQLDVPPRAPIEASCERVVHDEAARAGELGRDGDGLRCRHDPRRRRWRWTGRDDARRTEDGEDRDPQLQAWTLHPSSRSRGDDEG